MSRRRRGAARHRSAPPPRPRYGRIATALASVAVTAVALLGAGGLIPVGGTASADTVGAADTVDTGTAGAAAGAAAGTPVVPAQAGLGLSAFDTGTRLRSAEADTADPEALPARSGSGKRVVFDIGDQRVWLVDERGHVRRTYPVSGSLTDNLRPGTYEVYSTSRHALGIDDSGTMEYMVRFAYGKRAAIGFHDIPLRDGKPVQTRAELGTPQSHGCIRQWRPDARALWYFAIVGTKVVVTA
jgi:lipoprotein-anchoring transpeptidase ErfK/SrfK